MKTLATIEALKSAEELEKYHPHFMAAMAQSAVAIRNNRALPYCDTWIFPFITFTTEDWTRRSMALNGMRMSTEYFATGSPRIFTLIEQRLQAGQRDVVHDVVVYLWERVLQLREEMHEARALRAESLAAYLGMEQYRVVQLFEQNNLSDLAIQIESGAAGAVRRNLAVAPLVENLISRLIPELAQLQQREEQVRQLIDEITLRLYDEQIK
jgi:AraC-like DNA-binding protein